MWAADTSVLIDVLTNSDHADASEQCLRVALAKGPVVICEAVVSELVSGLGRASDVVDALNEMGIDFSAIAFDSAVRAGEMQRVYRQRLKSSKAAALRLRTVPDFLIGAHALLQCQGLITRDTGFFRDYFKGIELRVPGRTVRATRLR